MAVVTGFTLEQARNRIGLGVQDTEKGRGGIIREVSDDGMATLTGRSIPEPWETHIDKLARLGWDTGEPTPVTSDE